MFQGGCKCVSGAFLECFRRVQGFFHKNVINKLKYMDCNVKTLCKTSMMLMTMTKNPTLLQKVLEDWLRLPERQELFSGLVKQ